MSLPAPLTAVTAALARVVPPAVLAVASVVPSVFLHPLGWTLPLICMTSAALLLALPAGWSRVVYAVVWAVVVAVFTLGRAEGDLVVTNTLASYLLLLLALIGVLMALLTLPQARARHSDPGPSDA